MCSSAAGRRWGCPGVAEHEPVQDGQDVLAVLAGGVDVAADVEPVLGGVFAGEPAGDLLLCDTRSHEVSEHVKEVRLCRGRSYGLVFETVPAVTCVASDGRVRSSRKSPRAPVPTGCHRCGEGWAWATIRESLLMPRQIYFPGRVDDRVDRGWPL